MRKLVDYLRSSFEEVFTKVTWPNFGELQGSTVLVIVATTAFAAVVFAIDKVFELGIDIVYGK